MADIRENTVSSKGQVGNAQSLFGEKNSGKKLLFLGNSITRHSPAPQIGWNGDWGMAASSREKDYVHQTMKKVRTVAPDASFLVAQIALWEREFWNEAVIARIMKKPCGMVRISLLCGQWKMCRRKNLRSIPLRTVMSDCWKK